jgi:hypothetical protein
LGDKLIRLTATVENEGFLPTNVTQKAIEHYLAKPVRVELALDKAELLSGKAKAEIGHIKGNAPAERSTFGRGDGEAPQNIKTVEWLIRVTGKSASANLTVVSQKAGTTSKKIALETK